MDGIRSGGWQRGVLATCALAVLAEGETHGYAIAQRLQSAGVGPVRGGALYPVLNKLEQDGLLVSTWQEGFGGPGRKVFRLTTSGRERTQQVRDGWPAFAAAVAGLLGVQLGTPATIDDDESEGRRER